MNKKIKKNSLSIISLVSLAHVSFAADTLKEYTEKVTEFFGDTLATLLFTVATVAFFISVIRFLINRSAGKGGSAWDDAKERLLWSAGALFVMFSIWGIVTFFQDALLGEYKNNTVKAPTLDRSNSSSNNQTPGSPVYNFPCSPGTACANSGN